MWREKKLNPEFLKLFKYEPNCTTSCPIELAVPRSCELMPRNKELHVDYVVPHVRSDLKLIEADAFDFMHKNENETCRIKYKGPRNAVVSEVEDCTYGINVEKQSGVVLVPASTCKSKRSETEKDDQFEVSDCKKTYDGIEEEFVQVKLFNNMYFIYCYGSSITINQQTKSCINKVFMLPIGITFKINNSTYTGSHQTMVFTERWDPLINFRTNWNDAHPEEELKKVIQNLKEIGNRTLNITELELTGKKNDHGHVFAGLISLFALVFLVLGIAVLKRCCNKRKSPVKDVVLAENDQTIHIRQLTNAIQMLQLTLTNPENGRNVYSGLNNQLMQLRDDPII